MKLREGDNCCVCGNHTVMARAFDGTAWCEIHLNDWKAFYRWERKNYNTLKAAFEAWLKIAREEK